MLHVYNGDDSLYQTHEFSTLELFRATNSSHTNIRLEELEAWWIHAVGAEGLMGGASTPHWSFPKRMVIILS